MKEFTKAQIEFKLLKWFRKLFNYTPHIQPYIIGERKMIRISCVKLINIHEPIRSDYIEREIGQDILNSMLQIKAIKFIYYAPEHDIEKIEAFTYVPEKL